MQSDDITKLGLMIARMKGDNTEYDTVVMHRGVVYLYRLKDLHKAIEPTKQDLEYLAEQNEETKHIIVKLTLNGDLP